jgi:hypothetical protein
VLAFALAAKGLFTLLVPGATLSATLANGSPLGKGLLVVGGNRWRFFGHWRWAVCGGSLAAERSAKQEIFRIVTQVYQVTIAT